VPREDLSTFTMRLASRIAERSLFTLKLVKEAVNAAQDAQGRVNAMQTSFALHQISHAHNLVVHGALADPAFTWGTPAGPSASTTSTGEKA